MVLTFAAFFSSLCYHHIPNLQSSGEYLESTDLLQEHSGGKEPPWRYNSRILTKLNFSSLGSQYPGCGYLGNYEMKHETGHRATGKT